MTSASSSCTIGSRRCRRGRFLNESAGRSRLSAKPQAAECMFSNPGNPREFVVFGKNSSAHAKVSSYSCFGNRIWQEHSLAWFGERPMDCISDGRRAWRGVYEFGASAATSKASCGNPSPSFEPAVWPPWRWGSRTRGSATGTFLNGSRLEAGEWPLRANDVLRCGNITLVVDFPGLDKINKEEDLSPKVLVEACANSWEDALQGIAFDRNRSPRPGEQLLALLRAGHHLVHLESEEDLLHTILNDAVST